MAETAEASRYDGCGTTLWHTPQGTTVEMNAQFSRETEDRWRSQGWIKVINADTPMTPEEEEFYGQFFLDKERL